MAASYETQLEEVRAMLAAVNASILRLSSKTSQSVSFGDQSYTLTDIEKLMRVRDRFREEEAILEGRIFNTPRRTIKIHF
jgi:uncharacterized protein YfdQ (DUF2303 family)